jgi:hypothetical protein
MFMKKELTLFCSYESPKIAVEAIECEGVLCGSGTHQGFTESDEWEDLLDRE